MNIFRKIITVSLRYGLLVSLMITTICIFSACSPADINLAYAGTNREGKIAYQYALFNGKEIQRDDFVAGQEVKLDYSAVVKNGSFTFQVVDPDGDVLWSETVQEDIDAQKTIKIPVNGEYRLSVSGDQAKGRYRLEWPRE